MKKIIVSLLFSVTIFGCEFQKQADAQFGDQHFKTAIALIELHKIRYDAYPESLDELKFIGDWDQIALTSVKYEKLEAGYTLEVIRGWAGKPELKYPDEFWKGLGLKRTGKTSKPTLKGGAP